MVLDKSAHRSRSGKEDLARGEIAVPGVDCDAVEHDGHAGGGVGRGAAYKDQAWVCAGHSSRVSGVCLFR